MGSKRKFVLAMCFVALAFVCFGGMVKSNVAGRESIIGIEGGGSGLPYVTDGLMCFWDVELGLEGNKIKDIVGGYDITIKGTPTLDENGQFLNLNGTTELESTVVPFASVLNAKYFPPGWTIEVVASINQIVNDSSVIRYDIPSASHRGLRVSHGGQYYAQCIEYLMSRYMIFNIGSIDTVQISVIGDSSGGTFLDSWSLISNGDIGSWIWGSRGDIVASDSSFIFGMGCKDNWYCARVYNRTLTNEERVRNYKIDKARFNLP